MPPHREGLSGRVGVRGCERVAVRDGRADVASLQCAGACTNRGAVAQADSPARSRADSQAYAQADARAVRPAEHDAHAQADVEAV